MFAARALQCCGPPVHLRVLAGDSANPGCGGAELSQARFGCTHRVGQRRKIILKTLDLAYDVWRHQSALLLMICKMKSHRGVQQRAHCVTKTLEDSYREHRSI